MNDWGSSWSRTRLVRTARRCELGRLGRLVRKAGAAGGLVLRLQPLVLGQERPVAGPDLVREAYRVAVEERYRFYSFGDAMLILNGGRSL